MFSLAIASSIEHKLAESAEQLYAAANSEGKFSVTRKLALLKRILTALSIFASVLSHISRNLNIILVSAAAAASSTTAVTRD